MQGPYVRLCLWPALDTSLKTFTSLSLFNPRPECPKPLPSPDCKHSQNTPMYNGEVQSQGDLGSFSCQYFKHFNLKLTKELM